MSSPQGVTLLDAGDQDCGCFDLVVAADGARSRTRTSSGAAIVRRNREQAWGALWFVGPAAGDMPTDQLCQVYRGTETMIGFLPSGRLTADGLPLVSMFWSIRRRDWNGPAAFDFARWRLDAERLAPFAQEFLSQISGPEQLIYASYCDVVLRKPWTGRIVFIGDAAHAMSPQLGQGASLGLLDAATLARAIERHPQPERAFVEYAAARARHVRFYQFASRHLTIAFQSDWPLIGAARDALLGPLCRLGPTRAIGMASLLGVATGVLGRISLEPADG